MAAPFATAAKVATPVVVDRMLGEREWQSVDACTEFWQREPHGGQPPTEAASFRVVYDEEALCVAVAQRLDGSKDVEFDADGATDPTVDGPDLLFRELTGTLVARWDYRSASTIGPVGSHNGAALEPERGFAVRRSIDRLFAAERGENVVPAKLPHRFGGDQ